ncbi:MAG: universal stress protein [Pirellulales bacterium]
MFAPIRTIIVAVAMDERDAATLAHARGIAAALSAETVYLVHVLDASDPTGAAEAAVREKLRELATGVGVSPATRIELVVAHGDVTAALANLAARCKADLICVGRSIDSRADESTRGAVRVLRKSPCSVLIAPAGSDADYRRVLVAVDFSQRSGEAVEVAARLVGDANPITALHVYSAPLGYHKLGQTYEEAAAEVRTEVESESREWLSTLELGGARCEPKLVLSDDVSRTIANEADALDAGLLMVASHGRTQPAALILGHIADAVCRKTTRPMLCVKRKGEVVDLIQAIAQLYEWD